MTRRYFNSAGLESKRLERNRREREKRRISRLKLEKHLLKYAKHSSLISGLSEVLASKVNLPIKM